MMLEPDACKYESTSKDGDRTLYDREGEKDRRVILRVRGDDAAGILLPSLAHWGEYLFGNLPERAQSKGLILVTGETSCGKTNYLNALVYFTLREMLVSGDKPHVVAVGDPVETKLYPDTEDIKAVLNDHKNLRVRYTARTVGVDVENVRAATRDALRETPRIFVIGELREDDDFKAALRFAGTGHLVMATAHATSLVDAMANLMRIENATSASDRSTIAQRLAMLVFLRPAKTKDGKKKFTLPKLWRRNALGARSFVSDGLSSLQIPGAFSRDSDPPFFSESGMLSFAHAAHYSEAAFTKGDIWSEARLIADRWDLNHSQ